MFEKKTKKKTLGVYQFSDTPKHQVLHTWKISNILFDICQITMIPSPTWSPEGVDPILKPWASEAVFNIKGMGLITFAVQSPYLSPTPLTLNL